MDRQALAKNFLKTLPFLFRRIMHGLPSLSSMHHQNGLLFMVAKCNGMSMSYYSEKMMISRPNLTVMADRLIADELLERRPDPSDRRIVILTVTDKGRHVLAGKMKEAVRELAVKLEVFNDEEADRLNRMVLELGLMFDRVTQPMCGSAGGHGSLFETMEDSFDD